MFAKVVFNLPIEGPFDYAIPAGWQERLLPGSRVRVSFGSRFRLGYVVAKAKDSALKKVKPLAKIIDCAPLLDKAMLELTRAVADYYACSWGEAIEAALPQGLRKGKDIEGLEEIEKTKLEKNPAEVLILQTMNELRRIEIYAQQIRQCLDAGKGVIVLSPDIESAVLLAGEIKNRLAGFDTGLLHSRLPEKEELKSWIAIKSGRVKIAVGTRMAVFAPFSNLGLIIVQQEQSAVYKSDASPHYHAAGVARLRAKMQGARLILSGISPSLESWYEARKKRIKFLIKETEIPAAEIKAVDLKRAGLAIGKKRLRISIALEEAINRALSEQKRVLLFLNRRGFALFIRCSNCSAILRCPRCNANLILNFKSGKLLCHFCNYKTAAARVCPECNSGYIRYMGLGTEKLESELSRLYPGIEVARLDREERSLADSARIVVATELIFKNPQLNFGLIGVISLDSFLNRPDFRAAEKVFNLLLRLACKTRGTLVIQTNFVRHHCFQALAEKNIDLFFEKELSFRRQSGLPPFNHIIALNLRGRNEEKVAASAEELFKLLQKNCPSKSIKIMSYLKGIPPKKRDYYYEQVMIKSRSVPQAVSFLRENLRDFRHSGIIITVDVDPV